MKKSINLLRSSKNYQQKLKYFVYVRRIAVLLGIVTLILITLFRVTNSYLSKSISDFNQKLAVLEGKKTKEQSADSDYIIKRLQIIESITKNAHGYKRIFSTLFSLLPSSTQSAMMTNVRVKDASQVEIGMRFASQDALNLFLQDLESDSFIKHFKTISMNNLSIAGTADAIPMQIVAVFQ